MTMHNKVRRFEHLAALYGIRVAPLEVLALPLGAAPTITSLGLDDNGREMVGVPVCFSDDLVSEALHELAHAVFRHPALKFDHGEAVMFGWELVAAAQIGVQSAVLSWQYDTSLDLVFQGKPVDEVRNYPVRFRAQIYRCSFEAGRELGVLDDDYRITGQRADWSRAGYWAKALC